MAAKFAAVFPCLPGTWCNFNLCLELCRNNCQVQECNIVKQVRYILRVGHRQGGAHEADTNNDLGDFCACGKVVFRLAALLPFVRWELSNLHGGR